MKLIITSRKLKKLRPRPPCKQAMKVVGPLLPVTLYDNPERNLPLAIKLETAYSTTSTCETPGCCLRNTMDDLHWLADHLDSRRLTDVVTAIGVTYELPHYARDISNVMLIAQILAMIADTAKP